VHGTVVQVVDQVLCLRQYWSSSAPAQTLHSKTTSSQNDDTIPLKSGHDGLSQGKGVGGVYSHSRTPLAIMRDKQRTCPGLEAIPVSVFAEAVRSGNLFMLQRLWHYPVEAIPPVTGMIQATLAAALALVSGNPNSDRYCRYA
jgi:hypothetical protein